MLLRRPLHYKVFHFVRIEDQIEFLKRLQALLNRQSSTHARRHRSILLRWKARSVLWVDFPSPSASAGSLAGDERRSRHRDERDDAERPAAAAAAVVGERGQRRREAYRDAAQRR